MHLIASKVIIILINPIWLPRWLRENKGTILAHVEVLLGVRGLDIIPPPCKRPVLRQSRLLNAQLETASGYWISLPISSHAQWERDVTPPLRVCTRLLLVTPLTTELTERKQGGCSRACSSISGRQRVKYLYDCWQHVTSCSQSTTYYTIYTFFTKICIDTSKI